MSCANQAACPRCDPEEDVVKLPAFPGAARMFNVTPTVDKAKEEKPKKKRQKVEGWNRGPVTQWCHFNTAAPECFRKE